MKSKLFAAAIIAFSFVVSHVQAQPADPSDKWKGCYRGSRAPAEVINYDNLIVATNSGKALKAEQVKQAIIQAASEKKWSITSQADGKLFAMISVHGKHTVTVEISYSSDKYSLRYKDSTNMHYAMCEGQGVIHPNYNKWVMNLKNGIQAKLQSL